MIKGTLSAQYHALGKVIKPFGKDGWIKINLSDGCLPIIEGQKFVFFMHWGSHVPYFIEDATALEEGLLKLEEIDSIEKAQALNGMTLYINAVQSDPAQESAAWHFQEMYEYSVFNDGTFIGIVKSIDAYPMQLIATVVNGELTHLIPLNNDFVKDIDDRKKTVVMSLPYGLLDI